MSKFVKQLVTNQLQERLAGINYAFLVSLVGIDANRNHALRTMMADRGIRMSVIKNSLARRATEGTPIAAGFEKIEGACAVCWGAADVVALAKELVKLTKDKSLSGFEIKAAVLDGEALNSVQAVDVSKWPTREEQIAMLLGQIIGVGAKLNSQLVAIGGGLASQIKQLAEKDG
ncbi:MAG: 50S ribosomal protein L10 [Planctomycetaceae bacterium]|nr:50S ribosomal protein L10 [Planctomycetaceae bacterium]